VARTIAIGDIHGCLQAFETLLTAIGPQAEDLIVTLGDYVDRGPDSCGVVNRLQQLSQECQTVHVLGNHETMLLEAFESEEHLRWWLTCGGAETVASYGGFEKIPQEHVDFFKACVWSYETETHIFVHANYQPDLPMSEQPEDTMIWEHLNETPPAPHQSGKTAIVGHTPQAARKIFDGGHIVCIDTCCFGGGCLSAYDVDTKELWQADIEGKLIRSPNGAKT